MKTEEINSLRTQIVQLTQENQNLKNTLVAIQNSRSWKVASKLRTCAKYVHKLRQVFLVLWPLLSFKKIIFVGKDTSPAYYPQSRVLSGRYEILFKDCLNEANILCRFNYEYGESGKGTYLVSVNSKINKFHQVINLPANIQKISLEQINFLSEPLAIGQFSLKRLGLLQFLNIKVEEKYGNIFRNPQNILPLLKAIFRVLKRSGIRGLLNQTNRTDNYPLWVEQFDTLLAEDLVRQEAEQAEFAYRPLISIITPTYNTPREFLRLAIQSVLSQTYDHWELCIADDCSSDPETIAELKLFEKLDPRIKVCFREANGHISAASNSAIAMATGEFLAFFDHDDELSPQALFQVVKVLNVENNNYQLIYSDEDKINVEGRRLNPYFKPDFNYELFLQQNYLCHFCVVKKSIVDQVGGLRIGYEGAQDWDLLLRIVEVIDRSLIKHLSKVLYHWRIIPTSTASGTSAKPYVLEMQGKSVREHLQNMKINATVEVLDDISQLKISYQLPAESPMVSLIIPTKDRVDLLRVSVGSILDLSTYQNYEIIIVDNNSTKKETAEFFEEIQNLHPQVRVIKDSGDFNYSRINNFAVSVAKGEIIGLVNNDIQVLTPNWMEEMLGFLIQPDVGAVGARLYWPNNLLQHGGVVLGINGIAGHSHKGRPRGDVGYFNRIILNSEFSAVTAACMLTKKSIYQNLGGLDAINLGVAFNDVDYCLKVREAGYRIIYSAYTEMYHHESASRGYEDSPEKVARAEMEIAFLQSKWKDVLYRDPYYNSNLTLVTEDFSYSFPPR